MKDALSIAREAAHASARVISESARPREISKKGVVDLVTEVDRAAEDAIVEVLTRRSPQTPGGRTPGGQAYDVLLTHGVNGPDRLPPGAPFWGDAPASEAPLRNDGQLPPPVLPTFPWLAAP